MCECRFDYRSREQLLPLQSSGLQAPGRWGTVLLKFGALFQKGCKTDIKWIDQKWQLEKNLYQIKSSLQSRNMFNRMLSKEERKHVCFCSVSKLFIVKFNIQSNWPCLWYFLGIILPVVIVLIVITLSVFVLVGLYRMCWKTDPGR